MTTATRVEAVRAAMADNGWRAVVVSSPANRRYLTGFTADDHGAEESSGVVIVTPEHTTLLVSPTNLPWAGAEAAEGIEVAPWDGSWVTTVAANLADAGTVALEDRTTSAANWFSLAEELKGTRLVPAGSAIDRLRAIKSAEEIELLAQAARLTDIAMAAAAARLRIGMTERDAAEIVREELRKAGSDGEGFPAIVASGPNAAKPHHVPGDRPLAEGEPIIIDMGARVGGYNGDLTRTLCLGTPDPRLVTIYEIVLAAQIAGLDAMRGGASAAAPDAATRAVLADHGHAEHVIHGAGHGLGLRVHEAPYVSVRTEDTLAPGHVVTIEPGLYVPGWGGVRIEDVVAIEIDGHRNLTSAPKGPDTLGR